MGKDNGMIDNFKTQYSKLLQYYKWKYDII